MILELNFEFFIPDSNMSFPFNPSIWLLTYYILLEYINKRKKFYLNFFVYFIANFCFCSGLKEEINAYILTFVESKTLTTLRFLGWFMILWFDFVMSYLLSKNTKRWEFYDSCYLCFSLCNGCFSLRLERSSLVDMTCSWIIFHFFYQNYIEKLIINSDFFINSLIRN